MGNETRVEIRAAGDILAARQQGRMLATKLGLPGSEITLVAAAISEVARNIVEHAEQGEIIFDFVEKGHKRGLQIVARDRGPGIPDVKRAMEYGYSSRNGSGLGLPGAKWLMDEFDIQTKPGHGTTITMRKWVSRYGTH
jgi:serine/threonine-protein kinase RsbT